MPSRRPNAQLSSHQIRHYLNTLALAGGLGQLDVAKWSGRVLIVGDAAAARLAVESEQRVQARQVALDLLLVKANSGQ
jgi:hypothetical protein